MEKTEFIIILTQDRDFGHVFLPYLIRKKEKFHSIERHVKKHDLDHAGVDFKPWERKLVEIMDRYSDESLMKRFSKINNVSKFRAAITPEYYEKQILPFIEKCMRQVVNILMLSPVRLIYKEAKYPNIYNEDEIEVQSLYGKPVFYFDRHETETEYRLKIFLDDREIPLRNQNIQILTNHPCMILHHKKLIAFEKLDAKKLIPFFTKEKITIPRSFEEKYYTGFIRKTIRDFDVRATGFTIESGQATKYPSLTLEYNMEMQPALLLRFHYENDTFLPNDKREVAVNCYQEEEGYSFRKIKRNFGWEEQVAEAIKNTGLQKKNGFYNLAGARFLENQPLLYSLINWLNANKPQLETKGIRLVQGKLDKNYFTGKQDLKVKTRSGDDWFDVYATVTFGEFSFPFIKLKNYILNDIREFELPNGEMAIIPEEWFARYKNLIPFARKRGDAMQFNKHHYALIRQVLKPGDDSFLNALRQLTGKQKAVRLPDGLHATLRNYQKTGYRWMAGLHRNGFGGCLADDMGLGKTLQTLALLLKFKRRVGATALPENSSNDRQLSLFAETPPKQEKQQPASLIVLPTSLVHNWESEILKFAPGLKTYKHVGSQRKTDRSLQNAVSFYDIILTTYGTVRNDADTLSGLHFFYLILDESQYVKNPASKTYKAVIKLQGDHRLALTGTPIENSLSDLWAQMNFLNKGLLGNLSFFRRFFITPVEKHQNRDQQEKLQMMISPFILRRTKEEVARDLPPLMEQVVICEMEEEQERTYEREKSIIRNSILAGIENGGVNKSAMIILQGLTRLRQLANHPALLEDQTARESGKYEEIIRMLENVVAEKHKVLVFSSFVKHLELIRARVEQENWKYSLLTGQTSDRKAVIRHFQEDPDNRIFLISLKAGGVGLNLTGADYVFIIDPWWNPAAENQAISRAHRIGQNKHVFVYRFITQGSIEEKIQQLQQRKSSLADKFIHSNNPLKEISRKEIMTLFS